MQMLSTLLMLYLHDAVFRQMQNLVSVLKNSDGIDIIGDMQDSECKED